MFMVCALAYPGIRPEATPASAHCTLCCTLCPPAEDLPKEHLEEVQNLIREEFDNSPQTALVYSALAKRIRERLDKLYGAGWNVAVGSDFGAFVTQKMKCYAYLSVYSGVNVLLWKA